MLSDAKFKLVQMGGWVGGWVVVTIENIAISAPKFGLVLGLRLAKLCRVPFSLLSEQFCWLGQGSAHFLRNSRNHQITEIIHEIGDATAED